MNIRNEDLRKGFSIRLHSEFKRIGLKMDSHTHIARTINQQLPMVSVTAQAVRKWLLAEAFPSQDKLVMLADWLGVSAHWYRVDWTRHNGWQWQESDYAGDNRFEVLYSGLELDWEGVFVGCRYGK